MTRSERRGGQPTSINDALDAVRRELGLGDPGTFSTLVDRWEELVGSVLASRSRPAGLRDGVLRVTADDAVAATELRYRVSEVQAWVARVAPETGPIEVRVSMAKRDR